MDGARDRDPDREGLGDAVQDVAERMTLLVREEIALAKTEVSQKVSTLAKGILIGVVGGVFAFFGLFILLEGFAWLTYWAIPAFPNQAFFWGFFIVAGVLFVLGGLAGYLAARAVKSGSPPTPDMAMEEARRIRQTVSGDPAPPASSGELPG